MATRYWGGGTGTWDATTATNWYSDLARVTPAAAPTSADSVIFDSTSNATAYTVTLANSFVGTGTITGTVLTITAVTSGALTVGASIYTGNLPNATTYVAGGTIISSFGTGSGGLGTYNINISQTTNSATFLAGPACLDLTISGPASGAMTLAGSGVAWSIYGSMTLPATNLTWTATPLMVFCATATGKTITTNGVTIQGIAATFMTFDGTGGGWTLSGALTTNIPSTTAIRVVRGTFDTGNFNMTLTSGGIFSAVSTTRTITLGSSTLTLGATTVVDFSVNTGLTFNANTSTITASSSSVTFAGGAQTFNTVLLTSTSSGSFVTVTGTNTFNILNFTSSSGGTRTVFVGADQTINGTLTFGIANTATLRMLVASATTGTQRTFTVNGTLAALADVDFRDIKAAGTFGTPWTGTRLGNCGGNDITTITFGAGVTKYWNLPAGGNWNSVAWATTAGGATAVNNFPLTQDPIVIDDTNPNTSTTITINSNYNISALDLSARTLPMTIANLTAGPVFYGNVNIPANVTTTGSGTFAFSGTTTQYITSSGRTWTQPINISTAPTAGVTLVDPLTIGPTLTFTLTSGTLNLNNNALTAGLFNNNTTNTRAIAFGTANITVTGTGTVYNNNNTAGLTITGTPIINVTSTGSTAITVISGTFTEANALSFNFTGGTYALTFLNSNLHSAKNVNFTGYSGTMATIASSTVYGNLILSPTMSLTASGSAMTFASTSPGKTITTNGKLIDFPISFNGVGGSWQLQDDITLSVIRSATLVTGTLDLNNHMLTAGVFVNNSGSTRSIAFGTGNLTLTGAGTVYSAQSAGWSLTGTPVVNIINASSIATTVQSGGAASEALATSFNFKAGTYPLTFLSTINQAARNIDFTGFSGTLNATNTVPVYGNVTLSNTMTLTGSPLTMTFSATSAGKTIDTAGKLLEMPIAFNGVGGSWSLLNDVTMSSSNTVTLTNGTLDLNGHILNTGSSFVTAAGTKSIAFNSGTLTCATSSVTAFNNAVPTGFTTTAGTGTGIISMTGASAKTFVGGGSTYAATLSQDGAGTLTVSGNNTFNTITATAIPSTVTLTSGSTQTITSFGMSGVVGSQVTLNASTPGAAATLSQATGVALGNYLSLRDTTVIGGARWYAGQSTSVSNNTGWTFINGTAVVDIGQGITIGAGITFS